jgi:hypothetical protein
MGKRKRPKPSTEGTCIFCGSYQQKLTAEHLFADWISWSFWPQRRPRQHCCGNRQPLTGTERRWRTASLEVKTPQVCDRCNNVTLSGLENERIKPLLEPMMLNLRPTVLTPDQQQAFAAWIVSRMIVFHHMHDPEPHFFTAAQRKQFIETLEPPEAVQVWIGAFVGMTDEGGPIWGEYSVRSTAATRRGGRAEVRADVLVASVCSAAHSGQGSAARRPLGGTSPESRPGICKLVDTSRVGRQDSVRVANVKATVCRSSQRLRVRRVATSHPRRQTATR